ncbi:hypothetical protein [uncultured Martelella sp.]|nr:hypothetical protein [uncultured Martelella sp.]
MTKEARAKTALGTFGLKIIELIGNDQQQDARSKRASRALMTDQLLD